MKTAVIAVRQLSRRTGAARNVIEQAQYLKRMGYQVTILAEKKNDQLIEESGASYEKIWRWPFKGYYRRMWYKKSVERWRKKKSVDLMISHGECDSPDFLVMHNCVRLYEEVTGDKLPDVAKLHDEIISKGVYRRLIANSQLMKQDFVKRYRVPEEKVDVFYQGVDTETFNTNQHNILRNEGRAQLGLNPDVKVVGLVASGNMDNRNAEFFLKLAKSLSDQYSHAIRFVVVGSSKPSKYKKMAEQLGLSEICDFHPPLPRVERVFHALDLHVFPSKLDTFGRVVIEGLACGVPSLISDSTGAAELMIDHDIPYVLNLNDIDSWVSSALTLLKDEKVRSRLSQESAQFSRKFSMLNQFHEMGKILAKK